MSGIRETVFLSTTQIKCTFVDSIGNSKTVLGSGFGTARLKDMDLKNFDKSKTYNAQKFFITNRHNLDPKMKLGENTDFKLKNIEILFREQNLLPNIKMFTASNPTKFFSINNIENVYYSDHADVAIIYGDICENALSEGYGLSFVPINNFACSDEYKKYVRVIGNASFIGFPSINNMPVWDDECNLPIARSVNIASYPHKDFKNKQINSNNIMLVSGLSFSGSSGSIVLSHSHIDQENGECIPAKIIGIMSGHWQEGDSNKLRHSGLSYFTTTEPILEALQNIISKMDKIDE